MSKSKRRNKSFKKSDLAMLNSHPLNYNGIHWIGELEENPQRVNVRFSVLKQFLGRTAIYLFKNC